MPKKQPDPFLKYSSMAAKMIAIILVLTYIGVWLDKRYQMDFNLFTLLGAILGSGLAMYSVIKDLLK
ncbi:MAG: AtpZ/AtpI family protein [Salibacteraceae bacterium]